MNEVQTKAWDWLLPVEQNSLYLTLGTGKTSWEVGEMLNISHYKYLEIRERSETFFKIFVEFLSKYPCILRPDGPCQEQFRDYIDAVICQRKSRRDALYFTGYSENILTDISTKKLTKNLERLKNSDEQWDKDSLELILEFDRWNNFRILPKMWQRPSAYKRRVNKKHKIYIKYLLDTRKMPVWVLDQIRERFFCRKSLDPRKRHIHRYYISLISKDLYPDKGYKVLPIKKEEFTLSEMNKFYIYVFETEDDADSFGFLISNYFLKTKRIRLGLKFWPDYREVVKRAVNYNYINNIEFNMSTLKVAHKPLSRIS